MIDISLVVYKPRVEELRSTLAGLSVCKSEFRKLYVLVSGDKFDHQLVEKELEVAGLSSTVYLRYDNLGFAGGHNFLLESAFEDQSEGVLIYNPDLVVEPGALTRLWSICRQNGLESLYGPWIKAVDLADPSVEAIDSLGIRWTADGRHLDIAQGEAWKNPVQESVRVVEGLTGACLLVPRHAYQTVRREDGEFFDSWFVAYREDADLGLRCAAHGVKSLSVKMLGFSHMRGVKEGVRTNPLVNMLSVQNRFLMRQKLGRSRPGNYFLANLRDCIVIGACFTIERSSLSGLSTALKLRRGARYKGNAFAGPASD
ncbi:glycosyltransferase family 2 protein [Rhodococcus sp. UNC23MFCrub1.1]|uniref:glycosyltransferase family 2 protein n=1 Tax=Rhodococcus sp. UNC23MFCrub1.1 TaxID=1449068 RepID=UPI0012DF3CC5|nr:glycosyltransferase family 2 protein [Rhodococcus sp. UNC23MFCrub1.1]